MDKATEKVDETKEKIVAVDKEIAEKKKEENDSVCSVRFYTTTNSRHSGSYVRVCIVFTGKTAQNKKKERKCKNEPSKLK